MYLHKWTRDATQSVCQDEFLSVCERMVRVVQLVVRLVSKSPDISLLCQTDLYPNQMQSNEHDRIYHLDLVNRQYWHFQRSQPVRSRIIMRHHCITTSIIFGMNNIVTHLTILMWKNLVFCLCIPFTGTNFQNLWIFFVNAMSRCQNNTYQTFQRKKILVKFRIRIIQWLRVVNEGATDLHQLSYHHTHIHSKFVHPMPFLLSIKLQSMEIHLITIEWKSLLIRNQCKPQDKLIQATKWKF